jgi:O-succinylbenzoate synthase
MHIDSIQLFRVSLPAGDPLDASTADTSAAQRELIVGRLQSGQHVGWGDVTLHAGPVECGEWAAGAFACLRDWLAPALVGRSLATGEALQEVLATFQGNSAAKSVLDLAWWNLSAAIRGQPLDRLLGADRGGVPVSRSLGVATSPETLLSEICAAIDAGFDHVLLTLRGGWDVEMLRAVRQAFPSAPIAVDCDGSCTLSQQEMFYRLEDFFLKYVEQPFVDDDLVAHAMLQENLRTPICLDQSVTSLARAEQALDLGCCQTMRIRLARVGGLTPALAIRQACAAANVSCTVGGELPGPWAAAATFALAKLCGGSIPDDALGERLPSWVSADAACQTAKNSGGKLEARLSQEKPGELIDEPAIDAASTERASIG